MIKFEFSVGYVHEDADMSRLQPILENLQIAGEIWSQYLTYESDVTIELNVGVVHFNIPSFATARPFDGVDWKMVRANPVPFMRLSQAMIPMAKWRTAR